MKGLTTALRTLTILPAPGRDSAEFADSLYWFPVVGLVIGALLYLPVLVLQSAGITPWPEGLALFILLISVAITRGLHLDGLSDFADGFWGSHERDRILVIMKDSAIGTFGGIALTLFLLSKWMLITRIIEMERAHWVITACVASRAMQAALAASFPYARPEGGTAGSFVQGAGKRHLCSVLIIGFLFSTASAAFLPITAISAFAAAGLVTILTGKWSNRKIGGVTGDVIGTVNEFTEVTVLVVGTIA
ncbi:MAG: adenosylcobinamide-GDP ribazoletransferase [Verrucomicrobiota bacterium]